MFLCLFQGLGFLCLTIVTIFAEFPGVEGSLHAYKSMLGAGNRRQICESSKLGFSSGPRSGLQTYYVSSPCSKFRIGNYSFLIRKL